MLVAGKEGGKEEKRGFLQDPFLFQGFLGKGGGGKREDFALCDRCMINLVVRATETGEEGGGNKNLPLPPCAAVELPSPDGKRGRKKEEKKKKKKASPSY